MRGVIAYGAYVPATRVSVAGRARVVCSYDEDTTTMAVEAARRAVRALGDRAVAELTFVTTTPAYLDKTNATAIHAALSLPRHAMASDAGGAARSAVGALRAALRLGEPALVVAADVRTGRPGSADEKLGADAAAALVLGEASADELVAEHLGSWSSTLEFLDRWRLPEDLHSRSWEERFGYETYLELVGPVYRQALEGASVSPDDVAELVITGGNARSLAGARRHLAGLAPQAVKPLPTLGDAGAAYGYLQLCRVLDRAEPGTTVAWVSLADGVDVELLRVRDGVGRMRAVPSVEDDLQRARAETPYHDFLAWRGQLTRERPRRPDPPRPAAPPSRRSERWKFGLVGSRCTKCGAVWGPPQRKCASCGAQDEMVEAPIGELEGTVATFTLDHLAFSPQPPIIAAAVDLDGGGRVQCQLTDVAPEEVSVGDRVAMTFRRLFTTEGVHNYFWKARPAVARREEER